MGLTDQGKQMSDGDDLGQTDQEKQTAQEKQMNDGDDMDQPYQRSEPNKKSETGILTSEHQVTFPKIKKVAGEKRQEQKKP